MIFDWLCEDPLGYALVSVGSRYFLFFFDESLDEGALSIYFVI